LVYPARVQGDEASRTIIAAIDSAIRAGVVDVLIVGRGGGSLEDLRAFNDEQVARAVAGSAIPVVSAVGHETDVTLTDLVADRRAATPSAAAELVVPDVERLRADLGQAHERMAGAIQNRVDEGLRQIGRYEERMTEAVRSSLDRSAVRIAGLRQQLRALGPMAVLGRGYSLALDGSGRILRSVGEFRAGMDFDLRLSDGRVGARVRHTDPQS
jgi:exodeoxyribonuclease VII large subunit